ncbi:MAG: hypothetical protein JXA95_09510, partial [Spirochaetales bacterium]|nr:hypothetical protein [Spirochaetales bacterium]
VKGVLLNREEGTSRIHNWVEVYFERVGWFPVDPAMGDGALTLEGYDPEYFWGGITNSYLAFSRGVVDCGELDDRSEKKMIGDTYSNQSVYEEKLGNLPYYRSRWDLPLIINTY